jgi:hypothetical protein
MTNDDSPSLGGQPDDDAPMISGKQGKALAKLRGAYQVGNLDALIRHLSPEQQAALHRAVVGQALHYVEARLTHADEQQMVTLIYQWLNVPTDDQVDALLDHVFGAGLLITTAEFAQYAAEGRVQRVHFSQSNMQRSDFIRDLMIVVVPSNVQLAAWTAASLAPRAVPMDLDNFDADAFTRDVHAASEAAKRWQIEAAWAIIHNRPVPPLAGFASDDMEGEYRAGRLDALIGRMTEDQRARFRRALMEQLVQGIPPIPAMVSDGLRDQWRALIDAARRWLDAPTPELASEISTTAERVASMGTQSRMDMLRSLLDLTGMARRMMEQSAAKGARQIASVLNADLNSAAQAIVHGQNDFSLWEESPMDDVQSEEEWEALENAPVPPQVDRRRWQVEAAWAILQDRPLPPLTLEL